MTQRHPEWDTFYQVLYLGPATYAATQSEKAELQKVLRAFSASQSNNSEIVMLQPSYPLGLFIVRTKTEAAAISLPSCIEGYERAYDVVAITD